VEFRQQQIKKKRFAPPTCPVFRAQTANFAFTLEMLATSFQLIWTAVRLDETNNDHIYSAPKNTSD
jgi:hypothetical protein